MFQFVVKDVIRCKAIVDVLVNVDAISDFMETNAINVFRCRVANMEAVMFRLNASATKDGMDCFVQIVSEIFANLLELVLQSFLSQPFAEKIVIKHEDIAKSLENVVVV